jgi:hypothetical protein
MENELKFISSTNGMSSVCSIREELFISHFKYKIDENLISETYGFLKSFGIVVPENEKYKPELVEETAIVINDKYPVAYVLKGDYRQQYLDAYEKNGEIGLAELWNSLYKEHGMYGSKAIATTEIYKKC